MSLPQERDRVAGARLFAALVWTLAVGILAVAASTLILRSRAEELSIGPAAPRTIGSIEQTDIERTAVGMDLRAAQERDLQTWGWVDRDAGIAKIPIERAMDVVVGGP